MKKFWFFDLDGTLADTDRDIRRAWKAAIADLGLACPHFDEKFVAGPPIDEMAKILFPDIFTQELADSLRKGFAVRYDGDGFPETEEYPLIMDEVRSLKESSATVAIVTNKRFAGATAMAKHFGWDKVFDGIFAGDMFPGKKMRKTELLSYVLGKLGAEKDDSVLVGDTINDFEAARVNGVFSVGVSWGYGKEADLKEADVIVHCARELRAAVP